MISHIVACSENGVIGLDGKMPWHLPEDLKRFKDITSNSVVVMGRKTHESIGKPLPNRVNVVVSRQLDYRAHGCLMAPTLHDALKLAEFNNKVFIIGGGEIYSQSVDLVDYIYMTKVHSVIEGDTYYPMPDANFVIDSHQDLIGYSYITYRRKDPNV